MYQNVIFVSSAPSGACTNGSPARIVILTGTLYTCQTGVWGVEGGSGGGNIDGTVSATHLTIGTGPDTVGDSPATFASGLFTFPNNLTVQAHASMGVGSSIDGAGVPSILFLGETQTGDDSTALIVHLTYNPTVASVGGQSIYSQLDFDIDGTVPISNLSAIDAEAYNNSNTVTVNEFRGGYAYSDSPGNGNVVNQSGLVAQVDKTGSGSVAQLAGIWIETPNTLGTGTVTEFDGLLIGNISDATNNWAIKTGLGRVQFGDAVQLNNLTGHGTAGVVAIDTSGNLSNSAAPTISAANMTSFPASLARAAVSNPITSATGGSGTGTVACATASCTNLRGSYTVAGGTFATGTLLALVWPTTTTAYVCNGSVLNNATGASIGYHSVTTATGMTFSSLTAATGLNVDIDYACQP